MNKYDIFTKDYHLVKDSQNNYREAQILSIRPGKKNEYEYYVHYTGLDRRLDEWVPIENIVNDATLENNADTFKFNEDGRLTRLKKRHNDELYKEPFQQETFTEQQHEDRTHVKHISLIQFGDYEINTWYFSPYPEEYRRLQKLYICEYCLKYMKYEETYNIHRSLCVKINPPGKEIYRNNDLIMYEIDGNVDKLYCQNLCLLAKLFLDHKTIYYDVTPFMFYVLCQSEDDNTHIIGYFSKEKLSVENNNVACILTLPPHQSKGYGKFLISFSYELSKLEKRIGGPEKPLSDLGWRGYLCYWEEVVVDYLRNKCSSTNEIECELKEISESTCINEVDIKSVLEYGTTKLMKYYDKSKSILIIGKNSLNNSNLTKFSGQKRNRSNSNSLKIGGVDLNKLNWEPPIKENRKSL